jgi:hypothetical protein
MAMASARRQIAATRIQRVARAMNIDSALPVPVRRAMRWNLGTPCIVPLGLVAMITLDLGRLTSAPEPAAIFVFIGVAVAWAWLCRGVAMRALRRAAAHDHLLCPDCTYDLRALDANGTCPECGRVYEHDAVRATWLDAERRLTRGKDRRAIDEPPG